MNQPNIAELPKVSIVVPTYNEATNIGQFLQAVIEQLNVSYGANFEVIVVDDSSPDGTGQIVSDISAIHHNIKLLTQEQKSGAAAAVLKGFANAKSAIVLTINADFQHPVTLIPHLVSAIESGADVAIASRYVPGGSISRWSRTRAFLSIVATTLAQRKIGRSVKDPLSGFYAVRKSLLSQVSPERQGFKSLLPIMQANPNARIVEVPYQFGPRISGTSKARISDAFHYLKQVTTS